MQLDPDICYRAITSRDMRFDGRFFTAVRTTGIYCRPICPSRTPRRGNVVFYPCAAAAEDAGFRPCRRCRPDCCPGTPEWNGTSSTVSRALRLIHAGALDTGNVTALSDRLGIGERHLSRLFAEHLGASPLAVAQTCRAHSARKLIEETDLPMTEVTYASGYSSIRRFNDAIRARFGASPTLLREKSRRRHPAPVSDSFVLHLPYRPPLAWKALLDFLQPRCIPGVEEVEGTTYRRTLRCGDRRGRVEIYPSREPGLLLMRISESFSREILKVVEKARQFFDLRADPAVLRKHLSQDDYWKGRPRKLWGLRVPGAWDGFELAVRAILGQQVSVRGATTLAGRLAERLGEPVPPDLGRDPVRLFPPAEVVASGDLGGLGLTGSRQHAIRSLARAVVAGDLDLNPSADLEETRRQLLALPGIGPWTAAYIGMRALRHPDAFPEGDLGLRKAISDTGRPVTPHQLSLRARAWRPWRAYAAMYLWNQLSESATGRSVAAGERKSPARTPTKTRKRTERR